MNRSDARHGRCHRVAAKAGSSHQEITKIPVVCIDSAPL
ncbi:MAG: hypothetical protein [Olavius algarvensis Gamma 3 endosymbiont]|nr:MAG: hypothetical protein [Olavius algarvensis Gamma 3 endosymbiont]